MENQMKIYPEVESAKKTNGGTCKKCERNLEVLYRTVIRTTCMRGDDEVEKLCKRCVKKIRREYHEKVESMIKK